MKTKIKMFTVPNWAIGLRRMDYYKTSFTIFRNHCQLDNIWFEINNIIKNIISKPSINILEIGPGNGDSIEYAFSFKNISISYTAVEINFDMFKTMNSLEPPLNFKSYQIIHQDVKTWIRQSQQCYDLILCMHSLYRLWIEKDFIAKLKSLLLPSGMLICIHSKNTSPWIQIPRSIWSEENDICFAPRLSMANKSSNTLEIHTCVDVLKLINLKGTLDDDDVMFLLWLHPNWITMNVESIRFIMDRLENANINGFIRDEIIIEYFVREP